MRGGDAATRAEAIVDGGRRAGLRILMATGWGGLEPPRRCVAGDVLVVSSVPHATVLRHASAAIHHGGAGTVHAAARAGTPSVLVPFLADQPFWARLLHRSGLTGPPLNRDHLTTERVQAAIADAVERRSAVHRVAEMMRAENGPATAAAIVAKTATGTGTS
nr:nucleotide disphospho-sugar-binding domain-containing protein [Leucobacter weissii]